MRGSPGRRSAGGCVMKGIISLLLVATLLACSGASEPERGAPGIGRFRRRERERGGRVPASVGISVRTGRRIRRNEPSRRLGGCGAVRARTCTAPASPKDGVVLGSAPIVISAAAGDEADVAVAFDGTNYLVVWQDQRGSTGRDIYAARVSPDGTVLDPGEDPDQHGARAPGRARGGVRRLSYLVVWEDRRGGLADVRAASVSPGGSVLAAADLSISERPCTDAARGRVRFRCVPRRVA